MGPFLVNIPLLDWLCAIVISRPGDALGNYAEISLVNIRPGKTQCRTENILCYLCRICLPLTPTNIPVPLSELTNHAVC